MTVVERSHCKVRCVAALLLNVGLLAAAQAREVSFDGIWKISTLQASFAVDGGAIPFTTLGKEAYEKNKGYHDHGDYDEYDHMRSRCASPGLPRVLLTPERFQIFQRSDLIMMAFEWNRLRRVIVLPGLPTQNEGIGGGGAAAKLVGSAMGTSQGHWDGAALIITSDKFSANTLIEDLVPHGYDLKVTERLRLRNANTLEDRVTIEDPEYFTRPWTTTVTYRRQPAAIIPEDVCLDRLRGPPPLATQ